MARDLTKPAPLARIRAGLAEAQAALILFEQGTDDAGFESADLTQARQLVEEAQALVEGVARDLSDGADPA